MRLAVLVFIFVFIIIFNGGLVNNLLNNAAIDAEDERGRGAISQIAKVFA